MSNDADKKKKAWLERTPDAVLERILNTLQSPEDQEKSEQHPLGGLVHIEGIGQIPVTAIRRELDGRNNVRT